MSLPSGLHTQFVPIRLRNLDQGRSDLLILSLFDHERPPQGLAGLVDWRMDGLISRNRLDSTGEARGNPHYSGMALGAFACAMGEKLLFPISHKLPFSTAMVMGLGKVSEYDSARYRQAVDLLVDAACSLRAQSLTLRLPGWTQAGLPARRAIEAFVLSWQAAKNQGRTVPTHITFVEELAHQGEMAERIEEML